MAEVHPEDEGMEEFDSLAAAGFFATAMTWMVWDFVAWWAGLILLALFLGAAAIGYFMWRDLY